MNDRFRLVPAVYVLLRRTRGGREQVLLQLREGTGYLDGHWAHAAAGHVERGESVFEAAVRECAEELGIAVDPEDFGALTTLHRQELPGLSSKDHRVDFFVECRRWPSEPRLMEPEKAAALQWWSMDELPTPMVAHEKFVLDALLAGQLSALHCVGF
ncbi:NUDIX hydrolase [Rhodococcus pyridinivorans]|uniref:NUDIX hydrolase n=1 Tax=Rhodococcus pyridinivorans TaxID=103816 RepID=UPI00265A949A|nr:NUDIX domain-containing protein [Rhodococcus pyridinivorans]